MALEEQVDLVNEHDDVIGKKERRHLTKQDRYRMVTVILQDDNGNTLIHRRAAQKSSYPNRWENAAGGAVKSGQTYEEAAYEELHEEIGITDVQLTMIGKEKVITENGEKICGWFHGICEKSIDELILEPTEVAEAKWVPTDWLLHDRDLHPTKYMPSSKMWRTFFKDL